MRPIVFVAVCLACANHGLGMHKTGLESPSESLAAFLLAINPVAGWQGTGAAPGRILATPYRSTGRIHMDERSGKEILEDLMEERRFREQLAKRMANPEQVPTPEVERCTLPQCTVVVAGANGRVGSMVCRELLRKHPDVTVVALVRDAQNPWEGYGRLSYEVGAEEGDMQIRAAWRLNDDDDDEPGFMAPQTTRFNERMSGYGLDRLEIRECELRFRKDVDSVLSDADAVIYCATAFDARRNMLDDRLDQAGRDIARAGAAIFELRFGDALFGEKRANSDDDEIAQRKKEAQGKNVDADGLDLVIQTLTNKRVRRAKLSALTASQPGSTSNDLAVPLVVVSGAAALGQQDSGGTVKENQFGRVKRICENVLRSSSLPHLIVRSAAIDDLLTPEGLPVQKNESVVVSPTFVAERQKEERERRIHPRDLAEFLVQSFCKRQQAQDTDMGNSETVEVWTGRMEGMTKFAPGK